MGLFKKEVPASELGRIIYETIRLSLSTNTSISYESFLSQLGVSAHELPSHHMLEVVTGLLFGALLAVEKKHDEATAQEIMDGAIEEFLTRCEEGGFEKSQVEKMQALVAMRFLQYQRACTNESGAGPAWHLGKQYYWNILGREELSAMGVMAASQFLLGAQAGVEAVLKKYKAI